MCSSTATNNLVDVKSTVDEPYDIVVLPSVYYGTVLPSKYYGGNIDSVGSELPKSNSVVDGNKTYVYKNINEMARILVIPSPIEKIEAGAFEYGNSVIQRVVLSDSIKSIGMDAFSGCHWLTKINLPASIEEIHEYAFYDPNGNNEWICSLVATVDRGSYAETYCKKHGIRIEYRGEKPVEDSLPDWRQTYIDYFSQSGNPVPESYRFRFLDINVDGIPEIIGSYEVEGRSQARMFYINKNNEVKALEDFGYYYFLSAKYINFDGRDSSVDTLYNSIYEYDTKTGDYIKILSGSRVGQNKKDGWVWEQCEINGVECTGDEYDAKIENIISSAWHIETDLDRFAGTALIQILKDYK